MASVVTLLLFATLGIRAVVACEDSGFCSAGKLYPYVGDIHSSSSLRAALAARSYRNELIILVTTGSRLLSTHQTVSNLRKLGMEHILLISSDQEECKPVNKQLPHLGCTWDHFKLPVKGKHSSIVHGMAALWHTRWRTLARALRLGYNVMCTDSDVVFYDDPYKYFKSPPFRDYVVFNQPEVLYDMYEYQTNWLTNGGFVYVQNARPDGPAAWLIAEVSDRILRWIEDDFKVLDAHGMRTWCCYMDQDCFSDALSAVQTGRPFFHFSLERCTDDGYKEKDRNAFNQLMDNLDRAVRSTVKNSEVALPAWMRKVAGADKVMVRTISMKMPNNNGTWPSEWGGKLYPDTRGNLSSKFQQLLREDCGCPMWPDPENGADYERARALPEEGFMWVPPFLVIGWFPRGRLGYWYPELLGTPQQVIAHAHYIPDSDPSVGKNYMKMLLGQYDWALAHQELGSAVFFASQGLPAKQEAAAALALPPLLALHPSLRLDLLTTWQEFQQLLIGLAQVASVSGRTVVWPDLPCNSSWIAEDPGGAKSMPLQLRLEWMPFMRGHDVRCTWTYLCVEKCLFAGRGMLPAEFDHVKEHYRHQHQWQAHRHNTMMVPGKLPFLDANDSPAGQIVTVPELDVAVAMHNHSHQAIVYMMHPVQVQFSKQKPEAEEHFKQLYGSCPPLSYKATAQVLKGLPFKKKLEPRIKQWPGRLYKGRLFARHRAAVAKASPDAAPKGQGSDNEAVSLASKQDLEGGRGSPSHEPGQLLPATAAAAAAAAQPTGSSPAEDDGYV